MGLVGVDSSREGFFIQFDSGYVRVLPLSFVRMNGLVLRINYVRVMPFVTLTCCITRFAHTPRVPVF